MSAVEPVLLYHAVLNGKESDGGCRPACHGRTRSLWSVNPSAAAIGPMVPPVGIAGGYDGSLEAKRRRSVGEGVPRPGWGWQAGATGAKDNALSQSMAGGIVLRDCSSPANFASAKCQAQHPAPTGRAPSTEKAPGQALHPCHHRLPIATLARARPLISSLPNLSVLPGPPLSRHPSLPQIQRGAGF